MSEVGKPESVPVQPQWVSEGAFTPESERHGRERVSSRSYLRRIYEEERVGPNNTRYTHEWEYHRSGVSIILIKNGAFQFIQEKRAETGPEKKLKLVTAYIKDSETAIECARRELKEEAGLGSDRLQGFYKYASEGGSIVKNQYFFVAESYAVVGKQELDPTEEISEVLVSLTPREVLEKIRSDYFGTETQLGLLKALDTYFPEVFQKRKAASEDVVPKAE